ncbi:DedA family protein [Antarctobacter sp.]|uniref:DedA family protein n=1 Tax=Antarctobacter sp. TaxID=1872577 RepID=UPI002B2681A1|nr:DedA family protein [Antarctobacter sp.]
MTDTLFALVSTYGLWVVAGSAFLSCLAIPIPTAVIMLAAGGFAAAGDLVFWQVLGIAWLAAVAGDQTGFHIGRWGGAPMIDAIARRTGRHKMIGQARDTVQRWGGVGVFFSTWLFAPLGPWVNLIAGAARLARWRFTLWDVAGETIWVSAYVTLGFAFGSRLEELTEVVTDWSGMIASAAMTVTLAGLLVLKLRKSRKPR